MTDWVRRPIKHLADINTRTLPGTTAAEREFRYLDIGAVGRGRLVDRPEVTTFGEAPSRARRLVRPGDTIISTVRTYLRAVWPVDGPTDDLVVSTGFAVLSPRDGTDPGFLGWLTQSSAVIEEIVARSVGVSYPAINAVDIGNIAVNVPPEPEQRAVAAYLDGATARIDATLRIRRRAATVMLEWEQRRLLDIAQDWRHSSTRTLRQLGTLVVTGPFGTQLAAEEYVDGAIPVINPTHIVDGMLRPDPRVSVDAVVASRLFRHRLTAGDVVMGRKGDVGRSAVVSSNEDGWICGSDSIAIRTDLSRLLPAYLALLFSIDLYRQQLASLATGAMVASINEESLLSFRVPALPVADQASALATAGIVSETRRSAVRLIEQQVAALIEHRQALVDAAVTGQGGVAGLAA